MLPGTDNPVISGSCNMFENLLKTFKVIVGNYTIQGRFTIYINFPQTVKFTVWGKLMCIE